MYNDIAQQIVRASKDIASTWGDILKQALEINGFRPEDVLAGKHKLGSKVCIDMMQTVYICDNKVILVVDNDYVITQDGLSMKATLNYKIIGG